VDPFAAFPLALHIVLCAVLELLVKPAPALRRLRAMVGLGGDLRVTSHCEMLGVSAEGTKLPCGFVEGRDGVVDAWV